MIALAALVVLCATPSPFYWPKPEVVEEIDIPAVMKADGVPVRLHVMRSKLSVQQLLETFANAFVHAGFYVARVQKRHLAEPHVTGLDWRGLVSYTAILSPNADGTTTCMLGEAAVGKKTAAAVPDFAPLFPAARDVVRIDQESARVITYLAPAATADGVRAFYREQLSKAGYRESGEQGEFERGEQKISVLPKATGDGTVSVVLVQHP